jgi:hypothetical protein
MRSNAALGNTVNVESDPTSSGGGIKNIEACAAGTRVGLNFRVIGGIGERCYCPDNLPDGTWVAV